ncbi:MAG: type II secretion system protein [Phycisphaerae bacterium]
MNTVPSRSRPGFTLVELMTVIAIIMLLIGILIPALSAARRQAKQASTAGLLNSLGSGCEMFQGDFKRYPQSRGPNPFEGDDPDILLMGAQWLAVQLVGPDGRGFVNPVIQNDADRDGDIDSVDWHDWYALPDDMIDPDREYTRMGPYADVDAKNLRTVETFAIDNPDIPAPPEMLAGDAAAWGNSRVPFFVDAFGYPVLYYAATPKVDAPFTTDTPGSGFVVGRYDQADNGYFTGSAGDDGRWPAPGAGWDLAGAGITGSFAHPLGEFGYVADQTEFPDPKTFAVFVIDSNIFENTARGTSGGLIWPYRPDSFLLISPGEDALFGTGDDVTNFNTGR